MNGFELGSWGLSTRFYKSFERLLGFKVFGLYEDKVYNDPADSLCHLVVRLVEFRALALGGLDIS